LTAALYNVRQLLEQLSQGDRNAFDMLFRLRYSKLVSYASLLVERHDAEDVVQDVFVWMWRNRVRLGFSDETVMDAYLLRSVYHGCLNKIRRRSASDKHRDWYYNRIREEYAAYDPDNDPLIRTVFTKDLTALVRETAQELPPRCREVFMLAHMEGVPHRRIAEILGVSLSTVENHLYNALKVLRARLRSDSGSIRQSETI